jgi:subtilisin family serine protease
MIAAPAFAQRDLPPEARELPAFVPGSMWVKLDTDQPQVHETTMRVVRALAGVEQTKTYWLVPGLHLVRVPVGDERAFVSLLRDLEGVEWTSLEGVGSVTQAPPTCVQPSSNCEDANCADQYWVRKVNLHRTWKLLEGKELPEVVVAVMDSGVNYAHPDLAANMWQNPGEVAGIAGIDDDSNGVVDDVYGAAFVVPSPFEICNGNCGAYQFCPTCPNVGEPPQICTWCDQAGNPAEPPFYNGGEIQCLTSTPPSGDGGHGTACASIIASTANSIGVRGFGCNLRRVMTS